MQTVRTRLAVLALAGSAALLAGGAQAQSLLFWSTQATPVEEAQAMRDAGAGRLRGRRRLPAADPGAFMTRIQAEIAGRLRARSPSSARCTASFARCRTTWSTSPTSGRAGAVLPPLMELGKLGTSRAEVHALDAGDLHHGRQQAGAGVPARGRRPQRAHLRPADRLVRRRWRRRPAAPKFGFPAGPKGLKHRFFQGYLLPAYTGSMVTEVPLGRRGRGLGRSSRSSGSTPSRPRRATTSCRSR